MTEPDSDHLQAEFRTLCQKHDLTYEYSDDSEYWRRGSASHAEIRAFAKRLLPETAARIWNEIVDTKIIESHRRQFYWREG